MPIAMVAFESASGITGDDRHIDVFINVTNNFDLQPFLEVIRNVEITSSRRMNDQLIAGAHQAIIDHGGPDLDEKDIILVLGIS